MHRYGYLARARLAELIVSADEVRPRPTGERVATLLDAGSQRVWGGEAERGIPHFEHALRLDPESVDAKSQLAEALLVASAGQPLRVCRPRLVESLNLITDVQSAGLVDQGLAWSYLTESYVRQNLMAGLDREAGKNAWPALLAACRGLAYDMYQPIRWWCLADALSALGADALAVPPALHAARLSEGGEDEVLLSVEKLANAGEFRRALKLLGERDTGNANVLRAYLLLRLGDPTRAVRLLRRREIEPTWSWASEVLGMSLVLTGRTSEAAVEAEIILRRLGDRLDERAAALTVAWAHLWRGQFPQAEDLARKVHENGGRGLFVVGASQLLQGRHLEGERTLRRDLQALRADRRKRLEWSGLLLPQVKVLSVYYNRPLPPLDHLVDLAASLPQPPGDASRLLEIAAASNYRIESDSETATLTKLTCAVLLNVAQNRPTAAVRALDILPRPLDDVGERLRDAVLQMDPKPSSRPARADASRPSPSTTREPGWEESWLLTRVHRVITQAEIGQLPAASADLMTLLELPPQHAASLLLGAARSSESVVDALAGGIRQVSFGEEHAKRAESLVEELLAQMPIRLTLPTSWFAGHTDPTRTHPVFLRYLPEARLRTPELPPVRVAARDDREPDGYEIRIRAVKTEEGRIDRTCRYTWTGCSINPGKIAEPSSFETVPGYVQIAGRRVRGEWEGLLSMTAEEVVVRRLEALVVESRARIEPGEVNTETALKTDRPERLIGQYLWNMHRLAYRRWEMRGRPYGSDLDDWEAAQRLRHQLIAEAAYFHWIDRDRPLDDAWTDWFTAESETASGQAAQDELSRSLVDERLRRQLIAEAAYLHWLNRGRPLDDSGTDWYVSQGEVVNGD